MFTKTTRLTFVERLANYTITVHADISQPETCLNVIIIVFFVVVFFNFATLSAGTSGSGQWMDGWVLRQTMLSSLSTPGRAAGQSMTSPGAVRRQNRKREGSIVLEASGRVCLSRSPGSTEKPNRDRRRG